MDHQLVHKIKDEVLNNPINKSNCIRKLAWQSGNRRRNLYIYESRIRETINEMINCGILKYGYGRPLELDKVEWTKYRILNS